MKEFYTQETNFYGNYSPEELVAKYGSPLYVYNESILRERCGEMANLVNYPHFRASYSTKANSNLHLLRIIREEGLHGDAMSPGEIHLLMSAGFKPHEIFYISNNVSKEEMQFAIERDITTSIDSLSQLNQFGRLNPGGKVALRFNPGVGAGHHEKVVTGGEKTKFGIDLELIPNVKNILNQYNLKLIGINQHIGSLFMQPEPYIDGVKSILAAAEEFDELEFIDMGGGFGIPYYKQDQQARLNLNELNEKLSLLLNDWVKKYGRSLLFKAEPGRYVVAECGVLLGTVHSIKQNGSASYVGTDIGFNVLARPMLYNSYHDIEVYKINASEKSLPKEKVNVVGNICESGDVIASERLLPLIQEGDILGILDAGAYGYSMSSNYNCRLRPAEILIRLDGNASLIRRRETFEDLLSSFDMDSYLIAKMER